MKEADYIILGAGASGLLLAYRMASDPFFDEASIIIIDREKDKGNDRTWCYWEKGSGEWDDILNKTWTKIYFGSNWFSKEIPLKSYKYKMIRSADFYNKLWARIKQKKNILFINDDVLKVEPQTDGVVIETSNSTLIGKKVFSSLHFDDEVKTQSKFPLLQQHFIGWFIKTKTDYFDDDVATFMDFTIPQKDNTRFMYILPTSKREALFEYTLFSKELLSTGEYEDAIKSYLDDRGITEYEITEKERGAIPMTAFKFHDKNSKHLLYIGTVGGWTKASTGYTFSNTTKKTRKLVSFLKQHSDLSKFEKSSKFRFYDMLMLDVLSKHNDYGARLFSSMFKNSKVKTIFRFLDEESNFAEDLKVMSSVPPLRFVKALFKRTITC